MKFLEELDFTNDEINELKDVAPKKILDLIKNQEQLISQNITYLKDLGVNNYKEIFLRYYDMFLMDHSNFTEVFSKYETEDLILKLNKNIKIVEYL